MNTLPIIIAANDWIQTIRLPLEKHFPAALQCIEKMYKNGYVKEAE